MKNLIFLISIFFIILVVNSSVFSAEGPIFNVKTDGVFSDELERGNFLHETSDIDSIIQIEDSNGNIVNEIKGLESGSTVEIDKDGKLKKIKGIVGENTADITIDGRKCGFPAGSEFTFENGITKLKSKEGGEKLYCHEKDGDQIREVANLNMPNGELSISKDEEGNNIFSSKDYFEVYGDGTGKIGVSNFKGDDSSASISFDKDGKIGKFSNVKLDFDGDFSFESEKETSFYYDKTDSQKSTCIESKSYLCIDKRAGEEKITFGFDAKSSGNSFESNGNSPYFGENEGYVKISPSGSSVGVGREIPTKIIIEKDRMTVSGSCEMENGKDFFRINSEGFPESQKNDISTGGAVPIKVYTTDSKGEIAYVLKINKDGLVKGAHKVGYLEEVKYSFHSGGLYEFQENPKSKAIERVIAANSAGNIGSSSNPDPIPDFSFFDKSKGVEAVTIRSGNSEGPIGATEDIKYHIGNNICLKYLTLSQCLGDKKSLAISLCDAANKPENSFYIRIKTEDGIYSCGNKG